MSPTRSSIPICPLVTSAKDVKNFSGIDDFAQAPNGNLLVTYMGAKNLTTPGGLVELASTARSSANTHAATPGGPVRYMPSVNGVTDTGLLAHPHGHRRSARTSILLVTSDYADPLSLATSPSVGSGNEDCGTTVRFWKLSDLKAGPTAIAQLPVGKGRESISSNNAPEGVMSVALTHLREHKGVFAATMGGGVDLVRAGRHRAQPEFRMIYRVGPGASAAVFTITPDDRYLVQPIQGTWSPGDASSNRDYRASTPAGSSCWTSRSCWRADAASNAPRRPSTPTRTAIIQHIPLATTALPIAPTVTGDVNLDSQANFDTHGGPHFLAFDHETRRVAARTILCS